MALLVGCRALPTDDDTLHAESERFIKSTVTHTLKEWNFDEFWKICNPRGWGLKSVSVQPKIYVGEVEQKMQNLPVETNALERVARINAIDDLKKKYNYNPPSIKFTAFEYSMQYGKEQCGPIEQIEKFQLGDKFESDRAYPIDAFMIGNFQKKRAYIYCAALYEQMGGDMGPWRWHISDLYVTPVAKFMEKHIPNRSKFFGVKLSDF